MQIRAGFGKALSLPAMPKVGQETNTQNYASKHHFLETDRLIIETTTHFFGTE
jgi:hypothetical protein